jgi:APA family basic amino acid/polyamine antiporter
MRNLMEDKVTQVDKGQMKRSLGVGDLFAIGYGDLGSSIYYALGITAMYALGATPIALLLAGLVFVCTALTYAEMSSVMAEAGGSASFSRKTFNDLVSFIAGWALLLDYIVTIAVSAYSVGPYLAYFFPGLKLVSLKISFSIGIIILMVLLNIRGNKQSTRFSLILTALTIITQVVIVVIGLFTIVSIPEFFSHLEIGGADKMWSPTWEQFLYGVVMAMVAYTGIESMAQLSSEAINPKKTVPKAIVLAMGLLLVMYAGISVTALCAVTPEALSTTYQEDPIAGIVQALPIGSSVLGPWVGLLAAILLIVASNAGLIGASRLSFNMGEYFQLPRTFYNLHKKYKTPYISLLIFGVLASLVIVWSTGSLDALAELYSFGAMLAFFCAHVSLLFHRFRYPDIERPFRAPLNITIKGKSFSITAFVGAVMTLSVWLLVIMTKPNGRNLGLLWIAFGLGMYFIYRKKHQLSPVGQIEIEKVKVPDYKDLDVSKILLLTRGQLVPDTLVVACNLAKKFGAEISLVNIIEVPYMIPLSSNLLQKEAYVEPVLKKAQAFALEKGVRMKVRIIRARSIVKSAEELVEKEGFDLLIIGNRTNQSLGPITEKILSSVNCRVWICRPKD